MWSAVTRCVAHRAKWVTDDEFRQRRASNGGIYIVSTTSEGIGAWEPTTASSLPPNAGTHSWTVESLSDAVDTWVQHQPLSGDYVHPTAFARIQRDLAVAYVLNLEEQWRTPEFYSLARSLGLSPIVHARDLEQDYEAGARLLPYGRATAEEPQAKRRAR